MSVIEQPTITDFRTVTFDLYRDVHKGIRAEMFGITLAAGNLDPSDRGGRTELAARVERFAGLLETHAGHEDRVVQPAIEAYLPDVAETIARDHAAFDQHMDAIGAIAAEAVDATGPAARVRLHQLYRELAVLTGRYLAHQEIEEGVVMPGLEAALGVDAVMGLNAAIVGSIPPDQMAASLALMLPAMNVDDRTELLGSMQQGAPPEVFAGVWGLTGSVIPAAEHAVVAGRLGLD